MEKEKTENNKKENKEEEQKKDIPLFRKEALEHKKVSFFGKAIIISPLSFSIWTLGIVLISIALIFYLYFGTYSKRREVGGMLVPSKGLINVYPGGNSGIVSEVFVKQDEKVKKDQLLYLISTEQHTLTSQGAIEQQTKLLEKKLKLEKNKLKIFEAHLKRYKKLLDEKVISKAEYQEIQHKYLNIESNINDIEHKLIQTKGAGDYAIRAPTDGTISSLIAIVGDRVTNKPLATIIPEGAIIQAMLFVPSTAIGFVKTGQTVLLKYDAYPYQNFGLYESTVTHIDKSVLFQKDIDMPIPSTENPQLAQLIPFYRVFVILKQPYVVAYGKKLPLRPGMTLKASVLGDKRRIWQWILDPIFSLRGSLTSS